MRTTVLSLIIAMALSWRAGAQTRLDTIPFVGCPPNLRVPNPQDGPTVVAQVDVPSRDLAHYGIDTASGIVAPRAWLCQKWSGSAGSYLIVTTAPFNPAASPLRILDPAVEVQYVNGTEGRIELARYASQAFPKIAAKFIERVKSEGPEVAAEVQRWPSAKDSVRNLEPFVAQFTTPANVAGLGTAGLLGPSRDPIRGVVILCNADSDEPYILILRVRLGAAMREAELGILRLDQDWLRRSRGC